MLSASLATFTTGVNFCWTSPSIPILMSNSSHIPMTFEEASYLSVIPAFFNIAVSPFYGMLVEVIGRKFCVLLVGIPQLLSLLVTAIAKTKWTLYAGRAMAGIAEAASLTSVPIYIGEVAEANVRSCWGHVAVVSLFLGQFVINVIGTLADIRTTALICCIFPVTHVMLFAFAPESPYYLLKNSKEDKARKALQKLRWRHDVDEEMKSIHQDVIRQMSEASTAFKDLVTIASNRRSLIIALVLRGAQVMSGLPAFEIYASYMFEEAGGGVPHSAAAITFMGTLAFATALGPFVIWRCGTRPTTILSCLGCAILLTIETAYFVVKERTDLDVGMFRMVPLMGMISFILICGVGIGILPGLMMGELFSASVKGKASAVCNMVFALTVMMVSKGFQVLAQGFGLHGPFAIFTISTFAFTIICYYCVPETTRKTLEEIQQSLKENGKRRTSTKKVEPL